MLSILIAFNNSFSFINLHRHMASFPKLTGILWLALSLWGIATVITCTSLLWSVPIPRPADTISIPPNRLVMQAEGPTLLESDGITLVTATNQALLLNADSLAFTSAVTTGGMQVQIRQPERWRNYLSLLLRDWGQRDSPVAWQTARLKLFAFVKAVSTNSALTDEQLIGRFVTTVQQGQRAGNWTLIRHRQLVQDQLSIRKLNPAEQLQVTIKQKNIRSPGDFLPFLRSSSIVLWLAITLFIWYLFRTLLLSNRTPEVVTDSEAIEQERLGAVDSTEPIVSTTKISPSEPVLPEHGSASSDLFMNDVEQYITAFLHHYGGFYKRIQQLPFDASNEDRQRIRRELVEMGLHAYDFMSVSTYKDQQRFAQVPNIQLLLSGLTINELPTDRYRTLSLDPYHTEKRYRLLLRVLQELDIGELEGVLLNDVYVPKSLLTSPNHLS